MKKFFNQASEGLVVFLFSCFLAAVFTFPAVFNFNKLYIGDGWDNYEYASYQQLAADRIQKGEFPFGFTNFWRYPVGFDFARGFDSYLTVTLGASLNLIFPPVASYNLTIFLLFGLNGIFSYIFFKYLTSSKALGIVGALIYGFSFYSLARAGSHPNLLTVGSFALSAYAVLKLIREPTLTTKHYFLFFGSILFTLLVSAQYLILLVMFGSIFAVLSFFVYRKQTLEVIAKIAKTKHQFILTGLWTLFFSTLFYTSHIQAILNGNLSITNREQALYSSTPSITDYFLPNSYVRSDYVKVLHSTSLSSIEKVVFFGFFELAILILSSIYMLFKKIKIDRRALFFLLTLLIIPLALSFGYGKDNSFFFLPYHFLANFYPFKLVPETGRYFVIFALFATIALVMALNKITFQKKNLVFTVVIILLVLERVSSGFYLTQTYQNQKYQVVVKQQRTNAVLDMPVNPFYSPYNILSFQYQKPIVNGYFHWSADTAKEKSFITTDGLLSRFICEYPQDSIDKTVEQNLNKELFKKLKENNINIIVIHKEDKFFHTVCSDVRDRLGILFPNVLPLEPTTLDKENQVVSTFWEGKTNFPFFLPYNGTLYLDGAYIAGEKPNKMYVSINGQPLDSYYWETTNGYKSMQLAPKFTISKEVQAGSFITFGSLEDNSNVNFSLWYRYVPSDLNKVEYSSPFKKIYEDDKAIIYKLQ